MSAPDPEDQDCLSHGSLISTRPLPLRRRGGRTWNPLRLIWIAWRYGWSHPDEDLLGVIDAAGDSLRAQIASVKPVLAGDTLAMAIGIEQEIEQELCKEVPGLANLLGMEARINALYPPAIQRRRAWMLRERFERVAPARAVVEYWASNPPEAGGPEVLAEEVRRCESVLAAAGAALAAAQAAESKDEAAIAAAQAKLERAAAERDLARCHAEADRCRRAMGAATETARTAATAAEDVRTAAQAALDASRRTLGAALDSLDAAEETLVQRGGAIPALAGTAIDADAQTLLGYIHSSYMMSIGREKAVRDLMRWLIMRFWSANLIAVLVLLVVFVLFKALPGTDVMPLANLVVGLFFIAVVGRIGATMSVVQRLQSAVGGNILAGDAFLDLAKLRTGKNGINLALFSGAVFALLLYAIFATGAPARLGFENGLFPEMDTRVATAPTVGVGTTPVANGNSAAAQPDGATVGAGNVSEPVANSPQAPGKTATAGAGDGAAASSQATAAAPAPAAGAGNSQASAANPTVARKKPTEEPGSFGDRLSAFFSSLFTTTPTPQCKAGQACDPFTQFAEALGFRTRADFFKLLLWAFLSGFAERLVPDVLDSITRRTRNGFSDQAEIAARNRAAAAAGRSPGTTAEDLGANDVQARAPHGPG